MGSDDGQREPEGEVRMTPLERRVRWLLRCYPADYRRERGDEIIGTLLEATPDGRTWPQARDVHALVVGGLKARGAQNCQRTVGVNVRVAVMAGLALYASLWVASYLDGVVQGLMLTSVHIPGWTIWSAAVTALLAGATVALAWTAPRAWVLAGALAASAAVIAFGLAVGGPHTLLGTRLLDVLSLVGLAVLAPRAGHPSRHWLWLPGFIVVTLPLEFALDYGWFGYTWGLLSPGLPLLAIAIAGILSVAVDARLMVAVLTFLAVKGLEIPVTEISSGFPSGAVGSLPFILIVAAIAAPAVWLLRRQSGRPVR
jgi:hypothetical protein